MTQSLTILVNFLAHVLPKMRAHSFIYWGQSITPSSIYCIPAHTPWFPIHSVSHQFRAFLCIYLTKTILQFIALKINIHFIPLTENRECISSKLTEGMQKPASVPSCIEVMKIYPFRFELYSQVRILK